MTADQARQELFAAPLDRFVAERDRLASELAQSGAVAESRAFRKLRRPSPSAWLTNQVNRRAPDAVRTFFASSDAFRDAQEAMLASRTDRAKFQSALETVRKATASLAEAARTVLDEHGRAIDVHLVERVLGNFRAAALSSAARAALIGGELERDVQAEAHSFATVVGAGGNVDEAAGDRGQDAVRERHDGRAGGAARGAVPAPAAEKRRNPPPAPARNPKQEEAERRRAERQRALDAARAREAEAADAARAAQATAAEAQTARSRARERFDEQQRAAEAAREALRAAEADLRRAETELARANKAAAQAREQRQRQESRG